MIILAPSCSLKCEPGSHIGPEGTVLEARRPGPPAGLEDGAVRGESLLPALRRDSESTCAVIPAPRLTDVPGSESNLILD